MLSNSFFKRSLASAIALASVTLAAANANATNLVNYSTGSWSGKDTSVGSFGAGYGADFTVDVTNGALIAEASGNASIELFDHTVSIIDLSASANINDASSDGANLTAELVGVTVYEKSFNDGFVFDLSEDVNNYDDTFCVTFFDVSADFTIVVVPVTMSAGAEGCANLTFSATPQVTSHVGTLNLSVTPSLSTELTASVGVGSKMFSAGVEATVTLLDFSLPVTLNPSYNFQSGTFSYGTSGQIDLSMLDGSVDLYAKVDLGLWKKKYTYNLFEWEGISKSWYLWSNGEPSATSLTATIGAQKAKGSYTYTDTADTPEGSSVHKWFRNSTPSDTGRTQISSGTSSSHKNYTLVEADKAQYLQYCVTPKNSAGTTGDQQCSDWMSVGKLALLYVDTSYSTSNAPALAIPYENLASGTCVNITDYTYDVTISIPFGSQTFTSSYNDTLSSYKLYTPADSAATFVFYRHTGCSNDSSSDYVRKLVSANGSNNQTSTSDLGTGWNDAVSSFMVVYNEWVTAEDVAVSVSGNTASAGYTFQVSDGAISETESGSTYKWYRASSPSGTGSTLISGSTGSTHTLTHLDDSQFLKVCVTPSNGWSVGSEVCSGWGAVGHLLKFWEHDNYGGSHLSIAWEKSPRETCINMTDYSFNDKVSSYNWYNNNNANSTVWLYKDVNCGGQVATRTVAQGGSEAVSSVGTTFGSGWNDSFSSFKVSWNSSITIGAPGMTILGNKATEGHSYSDTHGQPEDATFTWYRASDSSGSGAVELENFNSRVYTLSPDDDRQFLKVCVLSSNGVVVDEVEACTPWTPVGPLVQLYADIDHGGTSINIAYTKSPSGHCFDLTNFGFNDLTSSFYATGSAGGSTLHTYRHVGCNDAGVQSHFLNAGTTVAHNYTGPNNDTRSSFKVIY
jgi:hypothetical protein